MEIENGSDGPNSAEDPMRQSGFRARRAQVDATYEAFVDELPRESQELAGRLIEVLGLAPAGIGWSRVFGHEITFGAPALVASGMPSVTSSIVREAVRTHMLMVLEGLVHERIATGRLQSTPELKRFSARMRLARDQGSWRIEVGAWAPESRFDLAVTRFEQAIAIEQLTLEPRDPVDFKPYERITLAKQALLVPVSDVLAQHAGWSDTKRLDLRQVLMLAGCALRKYEDVVDWEEASIHGGAWALVLARELTQQDSHDNPQNIASARREMLTSARREMFDSKVLARLLHLAIRDLIAVRKLAHQLNLTELAEWARVHALTLEQLQRSEEKYPGYAARAKQLHGWAETILT